MDRIQVPIAHEEQINGLYGDYDVDGTNCCFFGLWILDEFLSSRGFFTFLIATKKVMGFQKGVRYAAEQGVKLDYMP